MMVKVCGITRREDAEAAAAAGASALGFIFYPKSPRYVEPARVAELAGDLEIWKVGVFVEETAASIEAVMRAARLDVAQIYGGTAPADARVWRAFRLQSCGAAVTINDAPEAILLDGPANGISWKWEGPVAEKVIVAGGLDASNVAEAIRVVRPWGVDASSRLESSPGVKDHNKVRQFVEAALRAQA